MAEIVVMVSPNVRSPQHPNQHKFKIDTCGLKNKMDQLRLDDGAMSSNMLYDQSVRIPITSISNPIKSHIQPKNEYPLANSNFSYNETPPATPLNQLQIVQTLEMRRQEILHTLKQFDETNFKPTAQHSLNGNHAAYSLNAANDQHTKANSNSPTISSNDLNLDAECVNRFWNPTISSADYSYSMFQQSQANNNNVPPMLCDSQCQSAANEANRDIFVRSDSILTDDDYVPFELPAHGAFGPISRMSTKTSSPFGNLNTNVSKNDDNLLNSAAFFNDNVPVDNLAISTENLNAANKMPSTSTQAAALLRDQANAWMNNLQRSQNANSNLYANGMASFKQSLYNNSSTISPESMLQKDGECDL